MKRSSKGFTLVEIMIVVAIIGLLAALAVPNFIQARRDAQEKSCQQNLDQLEGAKEQWGFENNAPDGGAVGAYEIYLQNQTVPDCPGGGVYSIGAMGVQPVCTLHANA